MGTVLFVCVENTFRSVLSEAIFNGRAPSGWHAESAGVAEAYAVNPVVSWLLQEIGIEFAARRPKVVTPEMIRRATRVITFGCLDRCPTGAEGKSEDWPVSGATGKGSEELRTIRGELVQRIDQLLKHLAPSAETA